MKNKLWWAWFLGACLVFLPACSNRPDPEDRALFIKRYEDINGIPIGEAAPDQDAYAVTYPVTTNREWNDKNTIIMWVREELKEYATSFTAAVIIHELFHAIKPEGNGRQEIDGQMPQGCYAYGMMIYPAKFEEQALRPMCETELAWLAKQKLGENREVKLRKSEAWMEDSVIMAINFFNKSVNKNVWVYTGLK